MSTSVKLSYFSVSPFKELYCIQKNKQNLQRAENKGVGNEKCIDYNQWNIIFQKYFLLISNRL